jgi:coenzyme F420 biosynthesis associated uncharacterized protein
MGDLIDWELATRMGRRWAPSGPEMPMREARSVVARLRDLAAEATEPVARVTGMQARADEPAEVVDRPAWIGSNVTALRVATRRLAEMEEHRRGIEALQSIGGQASALQVGAALAWLSGKVLGQYEVFTEVGAPRRLLLVAPTIVATQRKLDVPERDFHLWVCLHEETHRVQFGAVPWLADYLMDQVAQFMDASEVGFAETMRRLVAILRAGAEALRGSSVSVMEVIQTEEQRMIFGRLTAVMSLLEGHADVVMDEVGPEVVPSVALIRERFTARRAHPKPVEATMRRALGMDAKLRQYSEGADFVRAVIAQRGMDGFNAVWTGPEMLPTREEVLHPDRWLARTAP